MWDEALWNHPAPALQWGVVLATGLCAAILDARTGKIPNKLVGPVLLAGLIVAPLSAGWAGLLDGLVGMMIMFAPYFLLFAVAGGGAGDAKLMAALGSWLGTTNGLICLICIAGTGVLFAFGHAVMRSRGKRVICSTGKILKRAFEDVFVLRNWTNVKLVPEHKGAGTMPYAVATFFGLCLAAGGLLLWAN